MKTSTIVWWIIGIIVVVGLVWWAMSASSTPSAAPMIPATSSTPAPAVTQVTTGTSTVTTSTTPSSTVLVSYTNTGFAPASVAVSIGQTVQFINQSTGSMMITSTAYPALDETTSVPTGGKYSFTFEEAGTWTYSNALKSTDTGTVLVQ